MKTFFLITISALLTAGILYSCKKNVDTISTEEDAVTALVQSVSFASFSEQFIPDTYNLVNYHKQVAAAPYSGDFLERVKQAGNNSSEIANAYRSVSLDYEKAILLKNKIDNDLLTLFNKNNFLQKFDEQQTRSIIVKAIDQVMKSGDAKWNGVKENINSNLVASSILSGTTNGSSGLARRTNVEASHPGLTGDEVWDCMKSAAGVGGVGVMSVAGLKKLAQEGIQQVVITVSKFLAEKAGWFGLAVMVIDFGYCLSKESRD